MLSATKLLGLANGILRFAQLDIGELRRIRVDSLSSIRVVTSDAKDRYATCKNWEVHLVCLFIDCDCMRLFAYQSETKAMELTCFLVKDRDATGAGHE